MQNKNLLVGTWLLPITADPIRNGAVVTSSDCIIDYGNKETMLKKHPDAKFIYYPNSVIMPGLIDIHEHLSLTKMHRKYKFNSLFELMKEAAKIHRSQPERYFSNSCKYGLEKCLKNGITCVVDWRHCGILSSDKETKIRHIIAFELLGTNPKEEGKRNAFLAERVKELEEKPISKTLPAVAIHSPYRVTKLGWEFSARLSEKHKIPIMAHVAETEEETQWVRENKGDLVESLRGNGYRLLGKAYRSSVELLDDEKNLINDMIYIHAVYLDDKDLFKVRNHNIYLCLCPKSNLALSKKTVDLIKLIENGIIWTIGTDTFNAKFDLLDEARVLLEKYKKRPEIAIKLIEACTINAARALKMDGQLGSIEIGKKADIAVFNTKEEIKDYVEYHLIMDEKRKLYTALCDGEFVI